MFVESITALMIASLAMGQTPVPATQIAPPTAQSSPTQNAPAAGQVVPAPSSPTIVVPAGTAIQLTLMSAVKSKSTKAGDTVRAVVAFPVTIGTQLAIPAGTFVDGSVIRVTAHPAGGQKPSFSVHFTRLVFSNGYSVTLNGENTQALLLPAESSAPANEVAELDAAADAGRALRDGRRASRRARHCRRCRRWVLRRALSSDCRWEALPPW